MFKKIILISIGICLITMFGCEVNKNPVATTCADTSGTHFGDSLIDRKPNIYIYPTQNMKLIVELIFPQGGSVIESIPFYNGIWDINVEPSGLINNQYTFLFYECKIPDNFQYEYGWQIEGNHLEGFFRNNLFETGFIETEINDFIEYWIPRLDETKNYVIFPQFKEDIDPVIRLNFSVAPESVLRLLYVIETNQTGNVITLSEPVFPEFERIGFTAAEWGVILK